MLLPDVCTCTTPLRGAVHCHHRDLPPALPAWLGSPGSLCALRFEVRTLTAPAGPDSRKDRFVKLSLNESGTIALVPQFTGRRHSSNPRLTASTAALISARAAPPVDIP